MSGTDWNDMVHTPSPTRSHEGDGRNGRRGQEGLYGQLHHDDHGQGGVLEGCAPGQCVDVNGKLNK